jgi:hypothetical protein
LDADLVTYMNHNVGPLIKAVRAGTLTSSLMSRASSCTHLMANHLQNLGVDDQITSYTAQSDFASFTSQLSTYRAQTFAHLQPFDQTLSLSDIHQPKLSQADFEIAKQDFATRGLSGVFHLVGDIYKSIGKNYPSSGPQPAVWNPRSHPTLEYGYTSIPHLVRTGSCSKPSESDCHALATTGKVLTYIGFAGTIECLFIPGVDFFCVALLGSVTIHGGLLQFFSDISGCP